MQRRDWLALIAIAAILTYSPIGPSTAQAQPFSPIADNLDPKLPRGYADPITARINQEIAQYNIVGLSVAITWDGEVVHVDHFGWEDREQQILATSQTMYRWASISKPLTAVVAMQLWEEGLLNLDADARSYVPEFPEKPYVITARQLLCHQGGIVHYTNGPVIVTPITRADLEHPYYDVIDALNTFKASPLVCVPGSMFSYTTHGYILLGAVTQRAEDRWYADQVYDRIIGPLGMTTLQPDYQWIHIPHRAVGYKQSGAVSTNTDVSWKLPGGGWISNVRDLSLLGIAMMDHLLVEPGTRQLMWTRQQTSGGTLTSWGLGFPLTWFRGQLVPYHGGGQEKASTNLLMIPDENLGVAVMCNTEGLTGRMLVLSKDIVYILLP